MTVSISSGAGLWGAGSITLSGGKGRTGKTKDQESGSKFIKVYGKSRWQSICFFLLCGYRKPRRLSDEQREQARLRMEKINSDDNCRED